MLRLTGVMIVIVCACRGSSTPAPSPAAGSAAAPGSAAADAATASCAEQAAHLGSQLRELAAAQPGFLPFVPGIKAPVTAAAKPIDRRGIVVAVTRDGTMFMQGQKLETARDVHDYLDDVHKKALEATMMNGGTSADATLPLYIWADAEAPVRAVAAVAAATQPEHDKPVKSKVSPEQQRVRQQAIEEARKAGILGKPGEPGKAPTPEFTVRLIVTSPDATSPPAAPAPTATEPEATTQLVAQLRAAIGGCAPVITVLATSSLEGVPAKEADKLATDIPKGLERCGCKGANLDALASGLRTWFGAWAPPLRWIELPKLDPASNASIGQLVPK